MDRTDHRGRPERLLARLLTGASGHLVAALVDWMVILRKVLVARWRGTDPWA